MERKTKYPRARFTSGDLRRLRDLAGEELDGGPSGTFEVGSGDTRWSFDSFDRWATEYDRADTDQAWWSEYRHVPGTDRRVRVAVGLTPWDTTVTVDGSEADIAHAFALLESLVPERTLPVPQVAIPPVRVFIGHGRDPQWELVERALREHHGLEVVAYEIGGARAGLTIKEVLSDMLSASSFAVLVMTAEDETRDGSLRPRQNVVHELGLFQGRLGFHRTVMLADRRLEHFSNMDGTQRIDFTDGHVLEAMSPLVARITQAHMKPTWSSPELGA